MDESEFVSFWAQKCKKNMKKCQKEVNQFVNSQIKMGNQFYHKLEKEKGRKTVLKLIQK